MGCAVLLTAVAGVGLSSRGQASQLVPPAVGAQDGLLVGNVVALPTKTLACVSLAIALCSLTFWLGPSPLVVSFCSEQPYPGISCENRYSMTEFSFRL